MAHLRRLFIGPMLVLCFLSSLALGVVLHLDHPLVRGVVKEQVSALLADVFEGDLVIDNIAELGLSEVEVSARLRYEGRDIVVAPRIVAQFSLRRLLATSKSNKLIAIDRVHVVGATVTLDGTETADLLIADAFQLTPSETAPGSSSSTSGPAVRGVTIDSIHVEDGLVTRATGDGELRATVASAHASLRASDTTLIDVPMATIAIEVPNLAGPVHTTADAHIVVDEEVNVEARLDTSPIASERLARLLPLVQPGTNIEAHVSAVYGSGEVNARALAWARRNDGGGSAVVTVAAQSSDRVRGSLSLWLDHVDAARFFDGGPTSDLNAGATASFETSRPLEAQHDLEQLLADLTARAAFAWTDGTLVGGEKVPPGRASATLRGGDLIVEASASEPALRVMAQAEMRLATLSTVTVAAHGNVDLSQQTRFDSPLRGRVEMSIEGQLSLTGAPALNAELHAAGEGLRAEGIAIHRASVDANVMGALLDPHVDLRTELFGGQIAGQPFERATATGRGTLAHSNVALTVKGGAPRLSSVQLTTTAHVEPATGRVTLSHTRADAVVETIPLHLRVAQLDVGDSGVEARGVTLDGLGESPAELSVAVDPGGLRHLSWVAPRISLVRIARLANLPTPLHGSMAADVELERHADGLHGRASLTVDDGRWGDLEGLRGQLDLVLEQASIVGSAAFEAADLGRIAVDLHPFELHGDLFSLAAYQRGTGAVTVTANVDLAGARALERAGMVLPAPATLLTGHVDVAVDAHRSKPNAPPTIEVSVAGKAVRMLSRGQFLDLLERTALVRLAPQLGAMDLRFVAQLHPTAPSGVALAISDPAGMLLTVTAEADVPYRALFSDDFAMLRKAPLASWAAPMPFSVQAQLPTRAVAKLPTALGTQDIKGTVAASVRLEGTIADPRLTVMLEGKRIHGGGLGKPPRGFTVDGTWRKGHGDIKTVLTAPRGAPLLHAHALLDADVQSLLSDESTPKWNGSLHVEVCRLPLAPLNRFLDAQVRGWLTGTVAIENLNTNALQYEVGLAGESLSIGGDPFDALRVDVKGDSDSVAAKAHLEDGEGMLDLDVKLPLTIEGTNVDYGLEEASARLVAKKFPLAIVQPFVDDIFDELDGQLDADVTLEVGAQSSVTGRAKLTRGRFHVASFGDTFFDTRADAQFDNTGIHVKRFEAKTFGGRMTGRGELAMRGLRPTRGNAQIDIDSEEALPIIVFGQHFGDAHGSVATTVSFEEAGIRANVVLRDFAVELSQTLPPSVQALEPSEHIRVGTFVGGSFEPIVLSPPEDDTRGADATSIRVDLDLGQGVRLTRGSMIDVLMRGNPSIEVTDRTRVSGVIRLPEGELMLQGKKFVVERGDITFTGRPPDNPMVVATAAWDAPEGTRVFADFAGPVKTGKVTLRSNPALAPDAILSLIVFGKIDSQVATTESGGMGEDATHAAGIGGGVVTEGLNAAVRDLTDVDLSTRIATSRAGNAAAEVELQIARDFSLIYSYILGLPPPGQNPDKNYGTVEWRFQRNWSLETSVGDHGSTSVDVLWERRY